MIIGNWIALLLRQTGHQGPVTFDDLVVGYDFGLVPVADIQAWVLGQGHATPACQRLATLEGDDLLGFEKALWAASTEVTGKAPRPGGHRWERAHDRWRVALLRDALEAPLCPEALAVVVEAIYERVGCPEDMVGLWQAACRWEQRPAKADREAIHAFLRRRDGDRQLVG